MSEAKQRQLSRERFLFENPLCCHCGKAADSVDHCPPKAFFLDKRWPEGFQFPSCDACNKGARSDDALAAVLSHIAIVDPDSDLSREAWQRQIRGLVNNQPEVIAEWQKSGLVETKHGLRKSFGPAAAGLRRDGWKVVSIGPLSQAALKRFMQKMAKTLYYKHCGHVLDGYVIIRHVQGLDQGRLSSDLESALQLAPQQVELSRGGRPLAPGFSYRFNSHAEMGVLHAVVEFSFQMVFQIMALRHDLYARLTEGTSREEFAPPFVLDARLPGSAVS